MKVEASSGPVEAPCSHGVFEIVLADAPAQERSLRCDCGSLLARKIGEELELKCRRCKRIVTVRWMGSAGEGT
jgi:hypothetical protein